MSYSIDANLLLYASNTGDPRHKAASDFLRQHGVNRIYTSYSDFRKSDISIGNS
jgi:predicted nucleic acid-binding protein